MRNQLLETGSRCEVVAPAQRCWLETCSTVLPRVSELRQRFDSSIEASHRAWDGRLIRRPCDQLHLPVTRNKPYDQMARERIAAQGEQGPVMHFQPVDEFREPEDVMAEQVRVFWGEGWTAPSVTTTLTRLGARISFGA